jgi:cytochrome c-type biogenesis protein CcmH/NrfG
MKRIVFVLILIPGIIGVLHAGGGQSFGDFKYKIKGEEPGRYVTITGYSGKETDLAIPADIYGIPVARLGDGAFKFKTKIESVTIPESVTIIDKRVFTVCIGLRSINIPQGVEELKGASLFFTKLNDDIKADIKNRFGPWPFLPPVADSVVILVCTLVVYVCFSNYRKNTAWLARQRAAGNPAAVRSAPMPRGLNSLQDALNKGNDLIQKDKYAQAEGCFKRALQLENGNLFANCGMGIVCFNLNRPDEAVEYFKKVLQTNPKHELALYHIGAIYQQKEMTRASIDYLNKAIEAGRDNGSPLMTTSYYLQALNYYRVGEYRYSKQCLEASAPEYKNNESYQSLMKELENKLNG